MTDLPPAKFCSRMEKLSTKYRVTRLLLLSIMELLVTIRLTVLP